MHTVDISYSVFSIIISTVMDSGNDGGALGTTAGSDCCCYWHDMLDQNHQERYSFINCRDFLLPKQQLIGEENKRWKIKWKRKKVSCMMK